MRGRFGKRSQNESFEDGDSDSDVDRGRVQNSMMKNEYSGSTQAVYEEIEVQHQSQSEGSWREISSRGHQINQIKSEEGTTSTSSTGRSWTKRMHYDRPTYRSLDSSEKTVVASKSNRSLDSSSQEQSVSTWFPIPSLSIFQSNSREEIPRVKTPLSAQSSPYDEIPQRDASSSFYSTSPVNFNERNTTTNGRPPLISPTENRSSKTGSQRRRERPWHRNSPKENVPQYHGSLSKSNSSSNNRSHSDRESGLWSGISSSPSSVLFPEQNNSYDNSFDSKATSEAQSRHGFKNPFDSSRSESPLMGQSESFNSVKSDRKRSQLGRHKNPFDSFSSSEDNINQPSFYEPRASSRSPERQRIIRPTPSLLTDNSKLHSLISCATFPNDPKWMEALQVLANAPNPRQLAKMKISHACDWTALHIAALSNPPLYLIYGLLLVYPEAVREFDSGGRLPIHLAAGSDASLSVLSILVRFYDDSVIIKEGRGLIPIHLALLRDGGEEFSSDIIRVLLGQNLTSAARRRNITRKVKDGGMRRGEHLNLTLSEVKGGVFGENPNTISMKERQKREQRMKNMNPQSRQSYSRGFATNINDVDSSDGIPYKHEYLVALWEDEGVSNVNIFGDAELHEAERFHLAAQRCLKKLAVKAKRLRSEDKEKLQQDPSSQRKMSPASIPAPNMRLPIQMAIKRNHQIAQPFMLPISKQNDILRILIHANPSSLIHRDKFGKTPIITFLELENNDLQYKIDLEMVELLLGVRTAGFRVAPKWLEDADIVESHQQQLNYQLNTNNFSGFTVHNPAMVPCNQTLPLHVASLNSLPFPIIHSIYSCYPGAKYVQDERESTPLHCALQTISQNDMLDLDVLCLLIDERVVRMRDTSNMSVLDLMIESSKNGRIPINAPSNFEENKMIEDGTRKNIKYQLGLLFQHSVLEAIRSSGGALRLENILTEIRDLPPWMRNIACGTPAIQKLLLAKVSSPMSTASVIVNGLALLILTIFFICMVDIAINGGNIPSIYVVLVLSSLGFVAFNGLCHVLMNFRLNIVWSKCFLNFWAWVTFFGCLLTFVSTTQIISHKKDIAIATVSIGLLWTMVIGYLSRWCYGISTFCLSTLKMVQNLISTFAVLVIFLISFMQMIYVTQRSTLGSDEHCLSLENGGTVDVCTIWESINIPYYLAIGGEFLPSRGANNKSFDVLILLFMAMIFILILHTVAISLVDMKKFRTREAMVNFYWVPMLTHVLLVRDICKIFCCQKLCEGSNMGNRPYEHKNNLTQVGCLRCCSDFERRLENTWEYICASFECNYFKNTKWWHLQKDLDDSHLLRNHIFVRFVGVFLIPLWFILGLLTFGILWPPQCRWWLFTWSINENNRDIQTIEEKSIGSPTILHEDVARMKSMIFESFNDLQTELHDIRGAIS